MKHSKLTIIILILFFFSGLASLICEVIWARKLGLVFGTTSYAISTVLAVFMTGLALGSFLFGKIVDRLKEPKNFLLLMGLLGIGEGMYALSTPAIFGFVEKLQLILVQNLNLNPSLSNLNLLRFCLSFLALILPTTLCGGTLPVLSKFLIRLKEEVGGKFALLYSLNTFGGVAGVILAGFFLIIPLGLGVNGTIYTAGSIDILAGLIFLGLSLKSKFVASLAPLKEDFERRVEIRPEARSNLSYLLLVIFFFTGFLALALEVLWTRALVMTVGSSTYAFSLILAAFLTGIALGSILIAKFVDRIKNLWFALAITLGLIGIFVIFLTPFFDDLPFLFLKIFGQFGESFWKFEAAIFTLIFLILLLPTFLMGITFPIGTRIYVENIQKVGGRIGEIYSINTLGCIFGSFLAGFLFLPAFGLQKSILICALIYFLLAALLICLKLHFKQRVIFLLLIIVFGISVFFLPQWNPYALTSGPAVYARQYFLEPETLSKRGEEGKIIFYKDGLICNVSVDKFPDGFMDIRLNGKADASAGKIELKEIGDLDTELLLGYLPLFLYSQNPSNALVIGLGSGITLGAIGQSSLKEIDLVEIEPAVVEAARYFREFNHNVLEDPRLKVIIEDGRNYFLVSQKKYDIISSEPPNPWMKGVANLFTKENFQLAKSHLNPGGIMLQWIHLYSLDKESLRTVLATFSEVFPNVIVWNSPYFDDLFLIGSDEPIKIDFNKFKEIFEIPTVKNDFQKIGISEPEEILANFIFSQEQIKNFSKGARPHTDNYPILEFRAPLSLYIETLSGNLTELYHFKEDIEKLFGIQLPQEVKDFQEKSLRAKIAAAQGKDLEKIRELFEEALKIKKNPILEGDLAEIYFEKGREATAMGKIEEAVSFYEKAAEFNPFSPKILNNLGITFVKQNDFENGEIWLKKAVETGPSYSLGFSNLGLLYLKQKKYDLAEKYLKEALEINEKNVDALNWLAVIYYDEGRDREAKELLEKSLKIKPDQPKTKEALKEIEKRIYK